MVEPLLVTNDPKAKAALPVPARRLILDIPRPQLRWSQPLRLKGISLLTQALGDQW